MKKAFFAALCFVLISCLFVNGTFALPDLNEVFADLTNILHLNGLPEKSGEDGALDVNLVSTKPTEQLMPGNSVSRTTYVKNDSKMVDGKQKTACFRLVYAFQYDAKTWDEKLITVDFVASSDFKQSGWTDITIDGTPYKMMVFTYTKALAAGAKSSEVTITVSLDKEITNDQLSNYRDDFLKMQVLAVEMDAFADVAIPANANSAEEYILDLALPLGTNPF